jgi:hypothetical protein
MQETNLLSKFKAKLVYAVPNPSVQSFSMGAESNIVDKLPSRLARSSLLLFRSWLLQGTLKMDLRFQRVSGIPRMIDKD